MQKGGRNGSGATYSRTIRVCLPIARDQLLEEDENLERPCIYKRCRAHLDNRESIATIVPEPEMKYVGTEDEIEIEGIAGMDFIEDEEDTRIEDGCVIVS
jgi:hypothetical protein